MLGTRSCLNLAKHLVALSKFSFAELRSVSLDVILDNPEDAANDETVRSIHREEPRHVACFACGNLISPLTCWLSGKEMKEIFALLDADGSGNIDPKESATHVVFQIKTCWLLVAKYLCHCWLIVAHLVTFMHLCSNGLVDSFSSRFSYPES